MEDAFGMFLGGGAGLMVSALIGLILLFTLGVLAFWIWMIVDCAQREFPPPNQNQKVVWILVIVLAGWIGALIYFFVVRMGSRSPSK